MPQRTLGWMRTVLAGLALALLAGCDDGIARAPVAPPSRPLDEAAAPPTTAGGSGVKEIALVLPRDRTDEVAAWEAAAREQAEARGALLTVEEPFPGDPADRGAEMIRAVGRRKPSALVAAVDDPERAAPALAEARDGGVPVVLFDRPVPVPGAAPPLVAPAPVEPAARALVAALLDAARAAHFEPDDPVILLVDARADAATRARGEALKHALADAGVAHLRIVSWARPSELEEQLTAALEANPRLALVVADGDVSVDAAVWFRRDVKRARLYVVGGFAAQKQTLGLVGVDVCAAMVDLNRAELAARAVAVAIDLAEGKPAPARVEVETPLVLATGLATRSSVLPPRDRAARKRGPSGLEYEPANKKP